MDAFPTTAANQPTVGAAVAAASIVGKTLQFAATAETDANRDYVATEALALGTEQTVAYWCIYSNYAAKAYGGVIAGYDVNNYWDWINGSTRYVKIAASLASVTSGITKGILNHLAITRSGTAVQFYLNGRPDGALQTLGASSAISVSFLYSMSSVAGAYYGFNGSVGDTRIYNRALSAAEIWRIYDPQTRWELYQPARPMIWWVPWGAITASDTATVGESTALTVSTPAITVADTATVGESVALAVIDSTRLVTASDAATVGESATLVIVTQVTAADSATVGESFAVTVSTPAITASDTATVGESFSLLIVTQVTAADSATVGESVALTVSTAQITATDSATVAESVTLAVISFVDVLVSANPDDGYWITGGGFSNASILIIGNGSPDIYNVFARWSITLPSAATIVAAHVAFIDYTNQSFSSDITTTISAHDAASPAAPTTSAGAAAAPRTTASVSWVWPSSTSQSTGSSHSTPDLATVIQELVNSYDYRSGAALTLYFDVSVAASGQALFFDSHDTAPANAPLLHIAYFAPPQFATADASTVAEAVALAVSTAQIAVADASTVADAATLVIVTQVTATDSATVAETIALEAVFFVAVSDASTVADSAAATVSDPQIAVSDASTVADAATLVIVTQVTATDTATVAESIALEAVHFVAVSDASTVADAATLQPLTEIVVSDSATLDESAQIIRELVDVRQLSTSSAVAVSDVCAVTVTDPQIVTSDASTVAESATVAFDHQVTASDASTVADSHAVTVSTPLVVTSDASTVADSAIVAFDHHVAASDAVGVTESITVTVSVLQIAVSDGVTVAEVVVAAVSVLQITVSDGVTVVESYTLHAVLFVAVTDAASLAESYTLPPPLLSLTASDAVSVSDSPTAYPAQLFLQSADAITVGDTIAMFVIVLHGLVDVTLADSAAYRATLADSALYNATVSDRTRTEGIG